MGSGSTGAVEMCNNNGACRKFEPGVMCPSFLVTQDEQHVTRGRANTLRLALTGQLGPDALTSEAMAETLDLCVGCKGCRRECPTGVDMARMKLEVLWHRQRRHGLRMKDRVMAHLPRLAPWLHRLRRLLAIRDAWPALARWTERLSGISARRHLPAFHPRPFLPAPAEGADGRPEIALLVDTFTAWFEPENARAAVRVLERAGYRVALPAAPGARRPLCCGRTFLAVGPDRGGAGRGSSVARRGPALRAIAEYRWWASSRRACSRFATSWWRCCPERRPRGSPALR